MLDLVLLAIASTDVVERIAITRISGVRRAPAPGYPDAFIGCAGRAFCVRRLRRQGGSARPLPRRRCSQSGVPDERRAVDL